MFEEPQGVYRLADTEVLITMQLIHFYSKVNIKKFIEIHSFVFFINQVLF